MFSLRRAVGSHIVLLSLAGLLAGGVQAVAATPASAAESYSSVVLASKPLAYWRLNQKPHAKIAVDDTRHHHKGRYASCVRLGLRGPIRNDSDTAGFFGKPGCWMTYEPSTSYAGAYSVEAWVKPSSSSKQLQTIFDTRSPNGEYSFDLVLEGTNWIDGQQLHVDVGDGQSWLSTLEVRFTFKAGRWYYIAATINPASHTAILYVNGKVLGNGTLQNFGLPPLLFDSNHPIAIGGDPRYDLIPGNPNPENFDGTIGQVAVYEHVLKPHTIAEHYKAGHDSHFKTT